MTALRQRMIEDLHRIAAHYSALRILTSLGGNINFRSSVRQALAEFTPVETQALTV